MIALSSRKLKIKRKHGRDKVRNPERLDTFYDEFCELHKKAFPDIRVGQLMCNFLGFVSSEKKRDPFFPEEDELLKLFREYCNKYSFLYRECDSVNIKSEDGQIVLTEIKEAKEK